MVPAKELAVESPFTAAQQQVIRRLAKRIVRLDLGVVAVLFIESARPLNFVGSQLLHFLTPFVHAFGQFPDYDILATLLEDRRCVDELLTAIEEEETRAKAQKV